jgi:hypothetical protein
MVGMEATHYYQHKHKRLHARTNKDTHKKDKHELILPNFSLRKRIFFSVFARKQGLFKVKTFFSMFNKHLGKPKFGKIDSMSQSL